MRFDDKTMTAQRYVRLKPMSILVLLVEDETAIRDLIRHSLPSNDFSLVEAATVKQAEAALLVKLPDIIIADWMLPGKSGIDFIRWLRAQSLYQTLPVILLTAKAEEHHKVTGLMQGADDYITKPFSPNELTARIKTVLRRSGHQPRANMTVGELVLEAAKQQILLKGRALNLRPMEFKLLQFFMSHPDKVFTREQLLNFVWGLEAYVDERAVDATIKRLREQLKPAAYDDWIQTIRGSGYLFGKKNHG